MSNPKHKIPPELPDWLLRLPANANLNSVEIGKALKMPYTTFNSWVSRGEFPQPDSTLFSRSRATEVRYWKVLTVLHWHRDHKPTIAAG